MSNTQGRKHPSKPKYNMLQNSLFMISLAWREKEKKVIFLALAQAIFGVLNSLIALYLSPTILSAVERHAPPGELVWTILLFCAATMLCAAASAYVGTNVLYGRITVRSALIARLNKKAATTSYPNVHDENFIRLRTKASTAVSSNNQATEAVWNTLTELVKNSIGFVIYLLLLFSLDVLTVLIILVTCLCGYALSKYLNGYHYRHRDELSEIETQMWAVNDAARKPESAKDIRLFHLRPWLEELGQKSMEAYIAFQRRAENVYIWSKIADLVLTFARNGIAYVYLIHLVLKDGLPVADFLLYFSAVGGFTTWVSGILSDLGRLHRQSLDLSTVREFLEYPEPFRFEDGEPLEPDPTHPYELKLEKVSFRYPGTEQDTLTDVNLTLRPGEKLAVVGLNGAGKTTLIKLMCGFLDPSSGRVLLNGKDIRDYNRRDYYRMFAAVFQDFSLIAATVAANVAQSEVDIDLPRVRACIAQAGLRDKIESLPAGYETRLNREIYEDALMLSGGETQRLMLARALYKNAPMLMLDEPTAALDPIAEAELYEAYNTMTAGRSSVYISHRLASTRFCDRILLIEGGGIAEEGTHEQLLARGGRYAELFEIQSKYYREEAQVHE